MRPAHSIGLIASLAMGPAMLPGAGAADDTAFALSFDPCPEVLEMPAGADFQAEFACVLVSDALPTDEGAQGWSLSLSSEGVEIVDITTRGTIAALVTDDPPGLREERSFEVSELSASGSGGCEGRRGAVSAVVLSLLHKVTLPPQGEERIARIVVQGKAPGEVGATLPASLYYVDGCAGSGWPVDNVVIWQSASMLPVLGRCDFEVKAAGGWFRRGDANDDGKVDLADPVAVLSVKFLGAGQLPCRDAADANDDGSVDVSDAISLLGFLFLGGYPPGPPGTARCGPDLAGDSLADCEYASCGADIPPLPVVNGGCGE